MEGRIAEQFSTAWTHYATTQRDAAQGAHDMATKLRDLASKIDTAHHKYEGIMAGLGAAAAIGFVAGLFTLGIGDAVADSAAIGAASLAIADLLEALGLEMAADAIGDILTQFVLNTVIGAEFSVLMQEGESIGAGDGLTSPDWSDTAITALTTGLFGGSMKALDELGDLGITVHDVPLTALKIPLGAGIGLTSAVAESEADGDGLPGLDTLALSTLLGAGGGALDQVAEGAAGAVKTVDTAAGDEARLAVHLGSLYQEDPETLATIARDPYQSDYVRYLANQYKNIFETFPDILSQVPELRTLLHKDPAAITDVVRVNSELTAIAKEDHLSPQAIPRIMHDLAVNKNAFKIGYDDLSDFVKHWAKQNHEALGDLALETSESLQ